MNLVNFKGIKSLTIDFGQVTEVRGANATGKSTIADAFNWVLFGKDAAGNSDTKFGIKTNDTTGKVIPRLDHEVTALLDVDGQTVELRRVLSEDWVTPRGKAEPELKGNTTSYFYNGVPLKESEYKAKVNDIISEDLFRMLTNPLHFPRLDWQVQREMLLRIAGSITLEEIANDRAEFTELLAKLSGKSLADYKAEISARKKKIKEALELIPARIDEVTRATPATPDFAALEAERQAAQKELEDIEAALKNVSEASRQEHEAQLKIQGEINTLKSEQQQAIFQVQQEEREAYNKEYAGYYETEALYTTLTRQNDNSLREIENIKAGIRTNLLKIADLNIQLTAKRKEYTDENAKEYNPNDDAICPTCGQKYPEDKILESKEAFEKQRATSLQKINIEGKSFASRKTELESRNEEMKADIEAITVKIEANKPLLEQYGAKLTNPPARLEATLPSDIPAYNVIQGKIDKLQASLNSRPATPDNVELTAKKREMQTLLDNINRNFSLKDVIDANNKRKAELLKEEKALAQQKADLEKQEFIADSLVKEQMNEVERRVNLKFNLVRFKMFSQQINGGEKPDCILISKATGAKFLDTNNADKINIGLDIIKTLCDFNGACAPIFIDNRESVTEIPPINSQIINLIVDASCKELTIN
ncbi:MAG: hypothetical protein LBS54_04300 [Dysgonamonadaceae bacterium]|nr:hypothetical protein [Dysgonamonadaceae bacterium]